MNVPILKNDIEFPSERVAWLEQNGIRMFDASGCMITFTMIFSAFPDTSNTAELDWGTVKIASHPFQKQRLNALGVSLEQENDGLGIIKRFWEQVYWETDENYPKSLLTISQDGKPVAEWIRLSIW